MTRFRTPRPKYSSPSLSKRAMQRFKEMFALLFSRPALKAYNYAILVVFICAFSFGAWKWITASSIFFVNEIDVRNNVRASRQDILRLGHVNPGVNIFSLNLEAAANEIKKHPWIKNVMIKRRLPDTIEISVKEHIPLALVSLDKLYLVDEEGNIFKEQTPGESETMPLITGIPEEKVDNRKLPEYAKMAIIFIKRASVGLRTLGINNISEIHFDARGKMVIYTLDNGIAISFGSLDMYSKNRLKKEMNKFFDRTEVILQQVLKSGRYRDVASIDLDYGHQMAVLRYKD